MSVFTFSDLAFMGAAAGGLDPDAAAYIARVEGASGDNQALEDGVKTAINDFVVGCKADGIWNAIKDSCIMAGARTLNGALQPLVGTAPTNVSGLFAAGDYNRRTGLLGNGSTKYLSTNRKSNDYPRDNYHAAVHVTVAPVQSGTVEAFWGENTQSVDQILSAFGNIAFRCRNATLATAGPFNTIGLKGFSRSSSSSFNYRDNGITASASAASINPTSNPLSVFARGAGGSPSSARMAFYSIGESLDLALLDARVTALINAFAAAIP